MSRKVDRQKYQGQSCRGKNFKNRNFSGACIQGTDFFNANLENTNFSNTIAGIQSHWQFIFILCSLVLSILPGSVLAWVLTFIGKQAIKSWDIESIFGLTTFFILVAFAIVTIWQGMKFSLGVLPLLLGSITALAFLLVQDGENVGILIGLSVIQLLVVTSVLAGVIGTALLWSIVFNLARSSIFFIAFSVMFLLGASFGVFEGLREPPENLQLVTLALTGTLVIALFLLSAYMGIKACEEDERYAWLRSTTKSLLCWRGTRFRDAGLMGADFTGANLIHTDLRSEKLIHTCWKDAINLDKALTTDTYLEDLEVRRLVVNLDGQGQNFDRLNLQGIYLKEANLQHSSFINTNLNRANLQNADLSNAILKQTQLDGADLTGATLTGACIEDWKINSKTDLNQVICDYVYLFDNNQERRPHDPDNTFALGEFTKLFQKALETVDLIFADGIDWKIFFQSFQELRSQYEDEELSIQAIEKKKDGTFLIRLDVPLGADKGIIERRFEELYKEKIKQLEETFSKRVDSLLQSNTNLLEEIVKTMAKNQPTNQTTNIHANNVGFVQSGNGTISHFSQAIGQNADEITRLITILRDQAQQFPEDQRDDALIALDDFQQDLKTPEKVEPNRIKRRIIALLTIVGILGTTVATATDFANNVLDLADKVGISKTELLEYVPIHLLPPSNQP